MKSVNKKVSKITNRNTRLNKRLMAVLTALLIITSFAPNLAWGVSVRPNIYRLPSQVLRNRLLQQKQPIAAPTSLTRSYSQLTTQPITQTNLRTLKTPRLAGSGAGTTPTYKAPARPQFAGSILTRPGVGARSGINRELGQGRRAFASSAHNHSNSVWFYKLKRRFKEKWAENAVEEKNNSAYKQAKDNFSAQKTTDEIKEALQSDPAQEQASPDIFSKLFSSRNPSQARFKNVMRTLFYQKTMDAPLSLNEIKDPRTGHEFSPEDVQAIRRVMQDLITGDSAGLSAAPLLIKNAFNKQAHYSGNDAIPLAEEISQCFADNPQKMLDLMVAWEIYLEWKWISDFNAYADKTEPEFERDLREEWRVNIKWDPNTLPQKYRLIHEDYMNRIYKDNQKRWQEIAKKTEQITEHIREQIRQERVRQEREQARREQQSSQSEQYSTQSAIPQEQSNQELQEERPFRSRAKMIDAAYEKMMRNKS